MQQHQGWTFTQDGHREGVFHLKIVKLPPLHLIHKGYGLRIKQTGMELIEQCLQE